MLKPGRGMRDDINTAVTSAEEQLGFDTDDIGESNSPPPRKEPVFNGFDDDQDYEEPERDTDYASRYVDDELDEPMEEESDLELDWGDEEEPRDEPVSFDETRDTGWASESRLAEDDEPELVALDEETAAEVDDELPPWEGEYDDEYAEETSKWPVALLAVGLVAIILLAAGGYGVLQQRAATEEEIRQLRAELATATRPVEAPVDNSALAEARQRNIEMSMAMDSLKQENSRLVDTVAGLEKQLEAQQAAMDKLAKSAARPAPKPAAPKAAAPKAAAPAATVASSSNSSATGDWFVNFGSYSQRAPADNWAAKLKPTSGRAVVTTGARDGKTFYRVRVIDLADKSSAERVARQLESEHGLGKLWVGR